MLYLSDGFYLDLRLGHCVYLALGATNLPPDRFRKNSVDLRRCGASHGQE